MYMQWVVGSVVTSLETDLNAQAHNLKVPDIPVQVPDIPCTLYK